MPIVCITGDVHHYLGNHPLEKQEYIFAEEYQEILEEMRACSTLFVTGKCIDSNIDFWKSFVKKYHVELGGHTYYALKPQLPLKAWNKFFGSRYGPKIYQSFDINRTLKSFEKIGIKSEVWRTHAYASNKTTYSILKKKGIRIVSDIIRDKLEIKEENGILHVPITTYPDDRIFTSLFRSKENRDEEIKKVKKSIFSKIIEGEDVVIQLHPVCMKTLDFELLRSTVCYLKENNYEFCTLTELSRKVKVF